MDKCRLCLTSSHELINMLDVKCSEITNKIKKLTNIQISIEDELPHTICQKCHDNVDFCLEFIQKCHDSNSKLQNLIHDTPENFEEDLQNEAYSLVKCEMVAPITDLEVDSNTRGVKRRKKALKQQCPICGKIMSSGFRLKTHLRTHTGERPYSCPHCDKKFTLEQILKVHLRIHTGEKPLSCTVCGEKFAHSAGLAAHKRKHTGQTPYQCLLCPRSFRTHSHFQYHTRRHTGEKKFECDTCNRAFVTNSDLKQHLVTHSGNKPHVCCVCGLGLTRAAHLKRHIMFIHKGIKGFSCKTCSIEFNKKSDLEQHNAENHSDGDSIVENTDKREIGL